MAFFASTGMARKRYKAEEIIAKLRQVDVLVSQVRVCSDKLDNEMGEKVHRGHLSLSYPDSESCTNELRVECLPKKSGHLPEESSRDFASSVWRKTPRSAVFLDQYEVQEAEGRSHMKYWMPAKELDAFNDAIVGLIHIVHSFPWMLLVEQSGERR